MPGSLPTQEELEIEIRRELRKQTIPDSKILLPQQLEELWNITHNRQFYSRQPWYDRKWDRTNEMREYIKIISILILARFEHWQKFREIFIRHNRKDEGLPFCKADLEDDNFLGPDFGPSFWEHQWIACPLVIEEREKPYELTGESAKRRFPYLNKPVCIGDGATGDVYKQVIAARHVRSSERGSVIENVEVC
jgi:hypothetical protein